MTDDEHELIQQCLSGRTRAFAVLVRRYQDRIYNTVFRMVGQAEDAQDIVQETVPESITTGSTASERTLHSILGYTESRSTPVSRSGVRGSADRIW